MTHKSLAESIKIRGDDELEADEDEIALDFDNPDIVY